MSSSCSKNLEIEEQNENNDKNVIIEDLEDVEYQEDREHYQADQQDLQEMSAKLQNISRQMNKKEECFKNMVEIA